MLADEVTAVQEDLTLKTQRHDMLWLAGVTTVITVVMFVSGLWGSGGHLAAPLDDTFIHLQYAQQLAAGHPFQYNTGDPPSSGDSAFIYPFLLAPAFLVGVHGMSALLFADLLNFAAHLVAVLLLYKLAFALGGRALALFSAGFFLLDGRLDYIFGSGMETGIYTAALIAFFWYLLRGLDSEQFAWAGIVGAFVALVRPEGHILVSLVCVLTAVYLWRSRRASPGQLWLLLPVLVGLAPYAINIVTTGNWQYNSAAAKSIWYLPYSPLREKLSLTVGYAITAIKDSYLGLEIGRSPFPLLALPAAVLGAGVALSRRRFRLMHLLLVLTLLGGVALALLLPPIQFNRYYQPYDFIIFIYLSVGILWLARVAAGLVEASGDGRAATLNSRMALWAWVAAGIMLLPQFVGYFFAFGDSTRDIYYQQMTFSDWIRRYTPKDARFGVNDIGAQKYLSDRYIYDLIGLASDYLRGAYFSGWGTVYDRLAALPQDQRPTYLLIHPNVFLNSVDESVSQSLISPAYSIKIQNVIISAGDTEVLYKINWDYAALDPTKTYLLHKGEAPLDEISIGNLEDEQRHDYEIEGRQPSISELKSIVTTATYESKGFALTDSGRRHSGWEQFTVKSVPGKALRLVSRSRLNKDADQQLLVWANGQQVGLWKVHNDRGAAWQEYEYEIPANFITSDRTSIRLDATFDPGGPGFPSYRYWSYAG